MPTTWRSNPFSSRFVRPGAVPFHFTDVSAVEYAERLRQYRWRAQIVGPHGSGKTTLLHALQPHLQRAGRELVWFTLRAGQTRLPHHADPTAAAPGAPAAGHYATIEPVRAARKWGKATLVIVDGYEQLGIMSKGHLLLKIYFTGAGLLVTTHRPVRLPTLLATEPDFEVFRSIVGHLAGRDLSWCPPAQLHETFDRADGNFRDAFDILFDAFESRASESGA